MIKSKTKTKVICIRLTEEDLDTINNKYLDYLVETKEIVTKSNFIRKLLTSKK